jgi:arginase family enzyme
MLRGDRDDGSFTLHNAEHGTSLDVEEESSALVETVLTGFSQPRTLEDFLAQHEDFPEALLVLLVRSGFVVEEDELPFLAQGFLRPTTAPVGAACSWSDVPELEAAGAWVVLGVPVDMHALGMSGARHGPTEIRKMVNGPLLTGEGDVVDYEFNRLYRALRPAVCDLGDVDPEGGRMDHVGSRLRKVVRELLAQRLRPLILGGDHAITHYVLLELIERGERFGVIHFDAHHDLLPSRALSHANVFRAALESPHVEQLVQIGLRVIERITPYAKRVACPKRTVVTAREVGAGRAMELLAALPKDIPYYLSFDVDCIDAASARETGTPAFGGLSFERASELVDYIARTFDLVGADFVEVSAAGTAENGAATMAAGLLQRCIFGKSEFEPLSTDVYVLCD